MAAKNMLTALNNSINPFTFFFRFFLSLLSLSLALVSILSAQISGLIQLHK